MDRRLGEQGTDLERQERLLSLYNLLPFHRHPLWEAVIAGRLTRAQVVRAEVQHFVRTRSSRGLRADAVTKSKKANPAIWAVMVETFIEECTDDRGTNHLDLVRRLVLEGGANPDDLDIVAPTPANAAAIALYRDISRRGFACHFIGAGAVEYYYADLCPRIFSAYTEKYGFTPHAAETYRVHGPMDKAHAERAFKILPEALSLHSWNEIENSVRDAFVATSLHYDGMLQAATGKLEYWNGGAS